MKPAASGISEPITRNQDAKNAERSVLARRFLRKVDVASASRPPLADLSV